MKIIKVTNGKMKQNCYILAKQDKKAILVDPGLDTKAIIDYLEKNKLEPKVVLLTHGHFDHIFSAKALQDKGAKVYITEADGPKLFDNIINMGFMLGVECENVVPDGFLVEGEQKFEGEKFEIVLTPGHTSGSCVIVYKNRVFTGDTYFEDGVYGRTDLLDGNQDELNKSIEKLKPLLKDKTIYAGHD